MMNENCLCSIIKSGTGLWVTKLIIGSFSYWLLVAMVFIAPGQSHHFAWAAFSHGKKWRTVLQIYETLDQWFFWFFFKVSWLQILIVFASFNLNFHALIRWSQLIAQWFSWLTATHCLNTSVRRRFRQRSNRQKISYNLIISNGLEKFEIWRSALINAAGWNIVILPWCLTEDKTAMVWLVLVKIFVNCFRLIPRE